MKRIAVVALAINVAAGIAMVAHAQQGANPWADMQQKADQLQQQQAQNRQRSEAAKRQTKAEPMPFPLQQLLTEGWRITSASMGPLGTQLVLAQNARWALCDLSVIDGRGNLVEPPVSRCFALN